MNMLGKAVRIASAAFEGIADKGGHPYILHCIRVMMKMDTEEEKIIAILHDVMEDGYTTEDDLRKEGFSNGVVDDLKLLCHSNHISYDIYIKTLSTSKRATKVKMADLEDNSNITRLKGLRKSDLERMEKYHRAYTYLSSV